ncbi:MAG: ATP-binding cassette domain-containing protein [Actinobacteria bacterium]|nr:ATP-binding cassette domain-containing protein [Actinomycetota bacterium]MSX09450.1 ATP-binding cassette domain-containing protein [Actinomycetota bacterium]MSX68877.1 ATP-binding cassette domain-containing protein [Actinomycetota bacterium]
MTEVLTGETDRRVASSATASPTSLRVDGVTAAELHAKGVHAWFGERMVLENVDLVMERTKVTALIGPSGCGKSTFLRILNRMHEIVPGASLAGSVDLDGEDIYDPNQRAATIRRHIGMVFQRPNPFPAMSVRDNVLAGLRFNRIKSKHKDEIIEEALTKAGLWSEVRDRLKDMGGALSGGQQQRLCIARALAVKPAVLLMDEPCSALDPGSTLRIEQTVKEIAHEVTVVIVTHNMQQAQRVSDKTAFFLSQDGNPGYIVETGKTEDIFARPQDPRTADYVQGRFG